MNKIAIRISSPLVWGLFSLLVLASCKKEEDQAAPMIENIRLTAVDSTITTAGRGATIAVTGIHLGTTQKVFFNDVETYVNTALITESAVIVLIPTTAPYKNSTNQIRLVTKFGEVSKAFSIKQPLPLITKVEPGEAAEDDTLTITGDFYDNLVSVSFGNLSATVVSSTPTSLKVKVPSGVEKSFINVVTSAGKTVSPLEFSPKGKGFFIYKDGLENNFGSWSWATVKLDNSAQVKSGDKSCKVVFGGYSALWFNNSAAFSLSQKKLSLLKFWVYGGEEADKKVQIFYQDVDKAEPQSGKGVVMMLKAKAWTEVTIPLSDLGSSPTLKGIIFQEFGGKGDQSDPVYFDDIRLQ